MDGNGFAAPAHKPAAFGGGKIGSVLKSRVLALYLLFASAGLAVCGTFADPNRAAAFVGGHFGNAVLLASRFLGLVDTYRSPLFIALLALLCLNLAWCTLSRFRRAARGSRGGEAWLDLAVHGAVILLLAGGAAKGALGFVGTRNIHVGLETETVYDWRDRRDVPLGFTIAVTAQEKAFYPHQVRIGVSRADTGEKIGLMELREGRPVRVPGEDLEITPGRLDRESGTLSVLATGAGGAEALTLETRPGGRTTAFFGPFGLTLVAFRDTLKSVRSRLSIREQGRVVAEEWLEPNGRIRHRGASLFQTAWGTDEYGNPYAGVQVTRDPGAPLFWAGSVIFCLSLPVLLVLRRKRQ